MVSPGRPAGQSLHPGGEGGASGGGEHGLELAAGGGLVEEGGDAQVEGLGRHAGTLGVVAAF